MKFNFLKGCGIEIKTEHTIRAFGTQKALYQAAIEITVKEYKIVSLTNIEVPYDYGFEQNIFFIKQGIEKNKNKYKCILTPQMFVDIEKWLKDKIERIEIEHGIEEIKIGEESLKVQEFIKEVKKLRNEQKYACWGRSREIDQEINLIKYSLHLYKVKDSDFINSILS